ncbi:enoyl-CoA hydratase/carnithine racemase [Rhizobium mongolense]|uniref:Enoyl-CoA hydratase/carnithine racemase n=1 Tax=Rhizobium mongolense TaxID=57676 RepID=A0A7W6WGM9_9HYPH|nr:enoyl-CoA hydratase/carnithine racemase [Rhizobium mongolense]
MQNNHEREVIIERRGTAGIIRLNRPKALNSLTLGMVRMIDAALDEFADDDGVASVVVTGEGDRASAPAAIFVHFTKAGARVPSLRSRSGARNSRSTTASQATLNPMSP